MSFNTALSGLRAANTDLEVTGNNIANASTTGFKRSRAEFGDVYANSLIGGGGNSTGSGVLVNSISQQFDQGNISFTDNSLDLAINGNGFFVLREPSGSASYTRAGIFGLDADGYITNSSGSRLQGRLDGTENDIQVSTESLDPRRTSEVNLLLNLDARVDPPVLATFDPTDADSYNSSTSLTVFDSLGNSHVMSTYYVKSPYEDNTWNMYAYIPDENGNLQNVVSNGSVTAADVTAATTANTNAQTALTSVGSAVTAGNTAVATFNVANATALTDAVQAARASLVTAQSSATTVDSAAEFQAAIDSIDLALAEASGTANGTDNDPASVGEAQAMLDVLNSNSPNALALATTAATTATGILAQASAGLTTPYYELSFGTDGVLQSSVPPTLTVDNWNPTGADGSVAAGGSPGSDFEIDIGVSTQFGSEFALTSVNQDGFATGNLSGLEISGTGEIFARYTNGEAVVVERVALASFANEQGLSPLGETTWAESFESGSAVTGDPVSGTLGAIQSGALEESNVDLSEELVRLIIAQRNYQANAKTIETADTVTQAIINLR